MNLVLGARCHVVPSQSGARERERARHDKKQHRAQRTSWPSARIWRFRSGGARNDPGLSVKADWDSSALQGALRDLGVK